MHHSNHRLRYQFRGFRLTFEVVVMFFDRIDEFTIFDNYLAWWFEPDSFTFHCNCLKL